MARTVFLLGATGLFGGHLARALIARGYDVVLAARSKDRLEAFAEEHGGRIAVFDRNAPDMSARLAEFQPDVVIDAAGPFQAYGGDPYVFTRAALEAGAHYLDLADAPGFVVGIAELNDLAQSKGLVAISGVSSTPAISAAAVTALTEGLDQIDTIETAIMPGNKTERGLSVIRAILAQAGQPFRLWRGGRWQNVRGWADTRRIPFSAGGHSLTRRAALHEAPETVLFPEHFKARTVVFRAGLELGVLHHGLSLACFLVRFGLMKTLTPFSGLAFRMSSWLKRMGSDQGGMAVRVWGKQNGNWEHRSWDLVAPDGVGPRIPAVPAELLVAQLFEGGLPPGARPALSDLSLKKIEAAVADFGVVAERRTETLTPLFARVLGDEFAALPAPVQNLHDQFGVQRFVGKADVTGAKTLLGRIAARMIGFPKTLEDIDVTVEIDANKDCEKWQRDFGGQRFHSVLSQRGARVTERFGPFSFTLDLKPEGDKLYYHVLRGRFLGVPMPRFLTPISDSHEGIDEEGRFTFDVKLSLPMIGLVAHYRGWLEQEAPLP